MKTPDSMPSAGRKLGVLSSVIAALALVTACDGQSKESSTCQNTTDAHTATVIFKQGSAKAELAELTAAFNAHELITGVPVYFDAVLPTHDIPEPNVAGINNPIALGHDRYGYVDGDPLQVHSLRSTQPLVSKKGRRFHRAIVDLEQGYNGTLDCIAAINPQRIGFVAAAGNLELTGNVG